MGDAVHPARAHRPADRLVVAAAAVLAVEALASAVEGKGLHFAISSLFLIGHRHARRRLDLQRSRRSRDRCESRARADAPALRRVTPRQAKIFLVLQCLVGLCVLLTFNPFAIGLGFSSILIVLAYPFMKRVTSWPQAVLGLAFAWAG